jgi:hypothetical protein
MAQILLELKKERPLGLADRKRATEQLDTLSVTLNVPTAFGSLAI